jgi:arylsulfatase
LIYDNHQVEPPRSPDEGYHLTEDLADKAIEFIADAKQIAPNKPFYLHFCTGATHAPHHVSKEWADRYLGQFDDGWDVYRERVFARQKQLGVLPEGAKLSRHDPDVPQWDSLTTDGRRLAARMMEVFAGFLSHTDYHIGRILDFLKDTGQLDNTLIMLVSDNGASAEGGINGTTNELQFFNNAPEPLEDSVRAIDSLGGDGPGQATLRSVGGSARPTAGAPTTPSSFIGQEASRPEARCATSTPISSTSFPPC